MSQPADRSPRNRLANESSPYLLLHASNPVDWYPWGEEAFAKARTENKPLFLSIGYSTCYWCHVMEREVFSDPDIAAQMNDGFVNIKLDREERPDLDEIYMTATQLLTRSGGWPNSLFLTHELAPFFAGTYFPPHDWHGRPGFPRILQAVREAWALRRTGVEEQARAMAETIREQLAPTRSAASVGGPDLAAGERLFSALERRFDPSYGGFSAAPKFPSPANLFFLLDLASEGDVRARGMLVATLDHMARGGIHDQLGGGFHRYSTDAFWLVPHFEKMLYDNAALARLYTEASVLEPDSDFAAVARHTLDFTLAELTNPEGAFLSAIDAETDGHEGAFYVFTREELRQALGESDDALAARVFGFDGPPNFENEHYILHLPVGLDEAAGAGGLSKDELVSRLDGIGKRLLALRATRPRPLTDDKVMADWNGLVIAALARAGAVFAEPRYLDAARAAVDFILKRLRGTKGTLQHTCRAGVSRVDAMLDDYAFLIDALLEQGAATGEKRFIEEALRLQDEQDVRLWDTTAGGYFAAGEDPRSIVRAKPATDGPCVSGMGVSAMNLARLSKITGEARFLERAQQTLAAFSPTVEEVPLAHVTMIRAARVIASTTLASQGATTPAGRPGIRVASGLESTALAVVEARGKLGPGEGEWRPFTLDLAIRSGWHINANPASHASLIPTQISGDVRQVRYPDADTLTAQFAAEAIAVYGGYVTIEGEVRITPPEAPKISLAYQACDEGRCLAPVSKEVALH